MASVNLFVGDISVEQMSSLPAWQLSAVICGRRHAHAPAEFPMQANGAENQVQNTR